MHLSIDFAPHVAIGWIALIAAAAAALTGYALWRRARGAIARAAAFAVACLVLANPLIVREKREPLPDIVALVVDHSASMNLDHRRADADNAAAELAKRIAAVALHPHIGQTYQAIVTGASSKGTFVRTLDPHVDGMVVRGAKGLDVGDRVTVKLVNTNPQRGYIDFEAQGGTH